MTCVRYAMLLLPLFQFLSLACAAGSLRMPRESQVQVARRPRAVQDNQLEPVDGTSTVPNHLPEEPNFPLLPLTVPTKKESRTPDEFGRVFTATTVAPPSPSTTAPSGEATLKPTSPSRLLKNSTAAAKTDSWTVRNSTSPTPTTEKAPPCNCSAEGTADPCDLLTSQCVCLPGYMGLQCNECEDGYFSNGTSGCQPCGCDSYGAVGRLCNSSGVCVCKMGVYGDKCDDCRPGFFHFSSTGCQPCQCNNHSSLCDTQSGICLNCQGNTAGPGCESCKYNFYRELGSALSASCQPCPCSSVTSSGSCTLDAAGQPVCDQCKPEYLGRNCEQCRDGFYNADSICVLCNCSGNAEPSNAPRICHPDTGRCLSCGYNTAGAHCEHCAPGFTGDALSKNCTAIVLPTPPHYSTMTPSPNSTGQLPTSSTALLSSLDVATTNATATADVSWAQFNVIVLAVIIVVLVALMGAAGGVYTYREYQNRKLNAPFWTIELKEDNISFSSYHDSIPNADVSGLLEDEVSEVASNGQLTLSSPGNLYRA